MLILFPMMLIIFQWWHFHKNIDVHHYVYWQYNWFLSIHSNHYWQKWQPFQKHLQVLNSYVSVGHTGSDNGLLPIQCQAIILTNAGIWLVNWALRNKFQWNLDHKWTNFIQENEYKNVVKLEVPQYFVAFIRHFEWHHLGPISQMISLS